LSFALFDLFQQFYPNLNQYLYLLSFELFLSLQRALTHEVSYLFTPPLTFTLLLPVEDIRSF